MTNWKKLGKIPKYNKPMYKIIFNVFTQFKNNPIHTKLNSGIINIITG